ncbi:MAG: Do family serine endopeptidase, partial [Acidobacteria bacterium]|nr:Do family serine endopeptidase [Acidobacteriota bacterium]
MDSKPVVIGRWGIFLSLLLVFLLGGGLMALVAIADGREAKSAAPPMPMALGANAANTPAIQGALSVGFASIVKPALPAVVNISSTKVTRTSDMGSNPFFSNPFFRQFFGDDLFRGFHMPRNQREKSLGSGVVVSPDGYILTNNHVVDGATDIQVFLNDKREFKARVIGRDPRTDIAVLKINATGLPVLPLGDSSKMQVGDVVLAIGDPFCVGETVTMGIVSATGRGHLDIEDYEDFIQTDAAINPGNSGGALMNSRGELIGINTAIISGGGGNQGVGFAIPINMANKVMQQIRTHGKVIRGYLGVTIQDVTSELQKAFGLRQTTGALVGDVSPNGPAARAGITKGDVILSLDGQSVADANSFKLRVGEIAPGSHATLRI